MRNFAKRPLSVMFFFSFAATLVAQEIPKQLRGTWIVTREIPTKTICCWDESQAKRLIGSEIVYTLDSFRWKDTVTRNPTVQIAVLSAEQFHDENSGGGANDSQVDFDQLGIKMPRATQITLSHEPADLTGGTTEIPGDVVLIKGPNTIVFSVCNVYFEAHRRPTSQTRHK